MRHATPRRVQYTTSKVRYVGDYIAFTASQFVALSHAVVMRFCRNSVSGVLLTYLGTHSLNMYGRGNSNSMRKEVWERVLILTGHRHVRYVQVTLNVSLSPEKE
jgi:hypothetical protein